MGDGAGGSSLLLWWRQPDDYQWRIEFLRSRGLLAPLRYLIAGIGATMGALAVFNVFVPPAEGTLLRIGWAVAGIGSLAWAARWVLLPWPTARASAALVVYVDILMTLSALLFGDPYLAISGIPILLCAGGYVVFFHGPRLHLVHIGWCTVSVIGIAAWLAAATPEHGLQIAVSRAVIALLVAVCILPALQYGFWLLQGSSKQALTDPLTELTNRRGLEVAVKRLNEGAPADTQLCAILIDVDGFKAINDSAGHAVGDEVLIRTARRIRASVRRSAVVVRWGGEEFLVVDRIPAGQAAQVAERVRAAVSAPAQPAITVSIGLATCSRPGMELTEAITAADAAMYEAKARGGDRVVSTLNPRWAERGLRPAGAEEGVRDAGAGAETRAQRQRRRSPRDGSRRASG
ncbi:MAG: GGDEF domain-containing protein [Actinomycetota bacterium]|nr:GGDEF domain-containing protein [Actinomycetota bacterium]